MKLTHIIYALLCGATIFNCTPASAQKGTNAEGWGCYLYDKTFGPNLLGNLVSRSYMALAHVMNAKLQYMYDLQASGLEDLNNIDELKKKLQLIDLYEQKNQIFLLGECFMDDDLPCQLNRIIEPKYRNAFEEKIVGFVGEKFQSNDKVSIASLGSGHMFQELVVLSKILVNNPEAQIDLHFIDIIYANNVKAKKQMNLTRAVNSLHPLSIDSLEDENNVNNLECIIMAEKTAQQFIRFLEKKFPKANISFFLHDETNSCVDYLDENHIEYPDVVMGSDIDCGSATKDYQELCKKVLNKKPDMKNAVLSKGESIELVSISFHLNQMLIESQTLDGLNLMSKDYRLIDIPFFLYRGMRFGIKPIMALLPKLMYRKFFLIISSKIVGCGMPLYLSIFLE